MVTDVEHDGRHACLLLLGEGYFFGHKVSVGEEKVARLYGVALR